MCKRHIISGTALHLFKLTINNTQNTQTQQQALLEEADLKISGHSLSGIYIVYS